MEYACNGKLDWLQKKTTDFEVGGCIVKELINYKVAGYKIRYNPKLVYN